MERPVCPACKSVRVAQASVVSLQVAEGERMPPGIHICLDCCAVYAFLPEWRRLQLIEEWRPYYEAFGSVEKP